jgi:small-conductance mechanosensitive channel
MRNYLRSIQWLALALLVLTLGFIWEDAFLIAFCVFLALIILTVQSALSASKTFSSKVKLLTIFSAVLAILIILGVTVMNPPQCPENYTQEQINAAHGHCIIGANIGIGLYFLFIVFPAALGVIGLWIRTLLSARKP